MAKNTCDRILTHDKANESFKTDKDAFSRFHDFCKKNGLVKEPKSKGKKDNLCDKYNQWIFDHKLDNDIKNYLPNFCIKTPESSKNDERRKERLKSLRSNPDREKKTK